MFSYMKRRVYIQHLSLTVLCFLLICAVANGSNELTKGKIIKDLSHAEIVECNDGGYFPRGHKVYITDGQIKSFKLLEVYSKSRDKYDFAASFVVDEPNFDYLVTARIKYVRVKGEWKMTSILPKPLNVASTGLYSCCLEAGLDNGGGLTGRLRLKLRNVSEITLIVGGKCCTDGTWECFSCYLKPFEVSSYGSNVTDYHIDFVEKSLPVL